MSAPLVVNTRDGACWLRCAVTRDGAALYAMEGAGAHPYPLMATEADLAEMGIVGSADVLPVPVGPAPQALSVERLAEIEAELRHVARVAAEATGWRLEDYQAVRGALHGARLVVTEAGHLRARVAELEAERHTTNEALADVTQALRASQSPKVQVEERAPGSAPRCRCDEPGADPYACEADDCSGEFSELNPFGGDPVQGHDAKVSRPCGRCEFRTSLWHVDDGSAEEELHRHVIRVHDGGA